MATPTDASTPDVAEPPEAAGDSGDTAPEGMSTEEPAVRTPKHLWITGILSLLWAA